MKLREARDEANVLTSLLSNVSRQLLLAGVAVVWLFSGGGELDAREVDVPGDLEIALFVFVVGLGFDFLQYVGQAFGTRWHYWRKNVEYLAQRDALEERGEDYRDQPVDFPNWIPRWATTFWALKAAAVFAGYVLLIAAVGRKL